LPLIPSTKQVANSQVLSNHIESFLEIGNGSLYQAKALQGQGFNKRGRQRDEL